MMGTKKSWLTGVIVIAALGFAFAGASMAQTKTTINVRNFELLSVDGNKLVVRDERGTNELTVPADFRFTVDGKQLSVSELKAGMKGQATITTTTTMKPVVVTDVRQGEVLRASDMSITVRQGDETRRYTRGELDAKGIQVYKDGKPVLLGDLKKGDQLTAMIVTTAPPSVLTKQEVDAVLAEAPATKAAAPAPAAPAPAQATPAPAQATPAPPAQVAQAPAQATPAAPAAAPAAAPQPAVAPPAPPAERSGLGLTWWIVIAVLIVLLFFFLRRKKQA